MIKPVKTSLWVILSAATLTVMAGSIIAPVLSQMGEGLGVDPSSARLLITTHGIMIAICSPLIGVLIDRVGVRKPFIVGLILYGLAGGSGLLINNYYLLIGSRVLLGISVAAIFTCITVIVLNLYQGMQRNKVMGWRGSSNSVGGIMWPLIGGALGILSWHLPFVVYLISWPIAIMAFFAIPETHGSMRQPIQNAMDNHESTTKIIKSVPILFLPYGFIFIGNILLYALVVFMPKLIGQFGITSSFFVGAFISISGLAAGITSLFYGKIKARLSYNAIVKIGLLLWSAGFIMISQAQFVWLISIAIIFFGTSMGIVIPSISLWVGELVPASFRGRMTSYITFFAYTGQFLSPIILSPGESSMGLDTLFLIIGTTCVFLLILSLVLLRRKSEPPVDVI
jgi:ACDE family multidrug resistance protein